MKKIITFSVLLLSVFQAKAQYSKFIQAVDEYVPAPGQFVNTLPQYEEGNTAADMAQKCTECIAAGKGDMITLGAYGGYVTFHFDHPVANIPGQKDFAVWGNAFYDNSEPAIVMVSVDENQNGLPDDTWYELAGSEYYKSATVHGYEITYTYDALNSPTIAETLLSTSPLLSPIFAAVLLRERVTKYNILGILISTAGVFALTLAGSTNYSIGSYWGIPLAFAAVSAAVIDSVMMRKAPLKYSALSFIFYTQLISLCFFIPIWFIKEGPQVFDNGQWTLDNGQFVTALWCVGYLTIFASVIAFILFCYALRQIGVTQANAFNNIRPAFTALWMILFFGEHLPLAKWIGMGLIIFGLFVCQKQEKVSDS